MVRLNAGPSAQAAICELSNTASWVLDHADEVPLFLSHIGEEFEHRFQGAAPFGSSLLAFVGIGEVLARYTGGREVGT